MTEILVYLLQTAVGLYLLALMLRFLLQWSRADFYNPISQFLVKITNPVVVPARRVVPGIAGLDLATLLLAILVQGLGIGLIMVLVGIGFPNPVALLIWSVLGVAGLLLNIYFVALLAMIILSWVAPGGNHPAILLLNQLTEPVMTPLRGLLPPMGGLDLSPILLFIGINVLQIALRNVGEGVGMPLGLVIGL